MRETLLLLAALAAPLPPHVAPELVVVPEMAVVPLAGEAREVRVLVRNLSAVELRELRLEPAAAVPCAVAVQPETLALLSPGDRGSFDLRFARGEASGSQRFPVEFRLSAPGHAALPGFRLLVDAGRDASAAGDGWLDVGVVRIGETAPASRAWALAALALIPVALLLWLGRRLKRKAAE